jgi:hypothetical protein
MQRRDLLRHSGQLATLLGTGLMLGACQSTPVTVPKAATIAPGKRLAEALKSVWQAFPAIEKDPAAYRFQALLSYPTKAGWQHESYRSNAEWVAPASMVKLPMAMLALAKLQRMELPRSTQLRVIDPASCGAQFEETAQWESIERSITRMLVVSDNGAFNRLFEFVGMGETNRLLADLGFVGVRIQARLGACTPANNGEGRAVELADANGVLMQKLVADASVQVQAVTPAPLVGQAYLDFADQRVDSPKNFAQSNHWRIADSHALLLAIAGGKAHPLFDQLAPDHQTFLRTTMSTLPRVAGFDETTYPDAWGKFLVHGDQKTRFPDGLQITNKIGQAYGFLTDSAWIRDAADHQCVLTATVYVNADGVLNDDQYEYDQIGFPCLATLGRAALALCKATG